MATKPIHHTIVTLDIVGFTDLERTDGDRALLRAALYEIVTEALVDSAVAVAARELQDRGDGILVLLLPEVPKRTILEHFVLTLEAGLRQHNRGASPRGRIRLRAAVEAGEVSRDEHGGVIGTAADAAFRLLDCAPLRQALALSEADLAVIVSDALYQQVVRQHAGLIAAEEYREVAVAVKSYRAGAWVWVRSSTGGGPGAVETRPPPEPEAPRQDGGVNFYGPVTQGTGSSLQNAGRDQYNVHLRRRRRSDG